MSKSYRKPYCTHTSWKDSARWDKATAARGVRRAQNQTLRDAVASDADWDEVLIPHKLECDHNDVWSWGRDGRQWLYALDHNDFNPFYLYGAYSMFKTEEELIAETLKDIERKRKDIAILSRK